MNQTSQNTYDVGPPNYKDRALRGNLEGKPYDGPPITRADLGDYLDCVEVDDSDADEDEQKSEWSEDEHPRADDGKFGSGGKNAKLSYRVASGHQMPKNGFEGERGNSLWKPPDGLVGAETVREALKEVGRDGVEYRRGFPRMEPFIARELGEGGRRKSSRIYMEFNNDRSKDFSQADAAYAEKLGWKRKNGKPDAARVARLRTEKELTWHHLEDCNRPKMILVSTVIHNAAHHTGGHSLCASK